MLLIISIRPKKPHIRSSVSIKNLVPAENSTFIKKKPYKRILKRKKIPWFGNMQTDWLRRGVEHCSQLQISSSLTSNWKKTNKKEIHILIFIYKLHLIFCKSFEFQSINQSINPGIKLCKININYYFSLINCVLNVDCSTVAQELIKIAKINSAKI